MDDPPLFRGEVYGSAGENKNFISEIAWAYDGQTVGFIVSPPSGQDAIASGVWFWSPAPNPNDGIRSYQLVADCRRDGEGSCFLANNKTTLYYETIGIEWARHNASFALVTFNIPDRFYDSQGINQHGIAVVAAVPNRDYYKEAPGIWFYYSGTWTADGRILVSGHAPDGRIIIAYVTPNGIRPHPLENEQVVFNAGEAGYWVQHAAVRSDGAIVTLARPINSRGAVQLMLLSNNTLTPIGGLLGNNAPQRVEWANNRNSIVVQVDGVQYIVNAFNGGVSVP